MVTGMVRQSLIDNISIVPWSSSSRISLPFLYCTRTISSSRAARRSREAKGIFGRHRQLHTTAQSGESESTPQDEKVSAFQRVSHERFGASNETTTVKRSTITKSEQAVFDRIFGQLTDDAKDLLPNSDEDLFSKPDSGLEDPSLSPAQQLRKIFEEAVRADRGARPESDAAKPESRKKAESPRGRKRIVEKVTAESEDVGPSKSEERSLNAALRQTCKAHKQRVIGMIKKAKTDVDVWKVLENEVFRLVTRQLDPHKQKGEVEKVGLGHLKEEREVAENAPAALPQTSQEGRGPAADTRSTKPQKLSDEAVSAILRHNYGSYCLYALRIYRNSFPYTPYALHVLTQIKSMGPVSTVLGVSSDFYNEIIYHHWMLYGDCGAIADLLDEMENQGLKANDATEKLVRSILRQHYKASQGHKGKALKVWSHIGPVKEKWLRLKEVYFEFVRAEEEEERSPQEPVLEESLLEGEEYSS